MVTPCLKINSSYFKPSKGGLTRYTVHCCTESQDIGIPHQFFLSTYGFAFDVDVMFMNIGSSCTRLTNSGRGAYHCSPQLSGGTCYEERVSFLNLLEAAFWKEPSFSGSLRWASGPPLLCLRGTHQYFCRELASVNLLHWLVLPVRVPQHGITWEENLKKGSSRSDWPVGVSLGGYLDC